MSHTIRLPWSSPPLTANQRHHWRKKAELTTNVRLAAKYHARATSIPPMNKCRVGLVWVVTTKHRRDVDNIVPTLKALCDGLVDAGVVPDDTPQFMEKVMPVIRYEPGGTAHMELTVEPVEEYRREFTAPQTTNHTNGSDDA